MMNSKNKPLISPVLLLLCLLINSTLSAQLHSQTQKVDTSVFSHSVNLSGNWLLINAEDSLNIHANYDSAQPILVHSENIYNSENHLNSNELIWLRKSIHIDSTLVNKKLMLYSFGSGKLFIRVDSSKAYFLGKQQDGGIKDSYLIEFDNPGKHVLTASLYNPDGESYNDAGLISGFYISLSTADNFFRSIRENTAFYSSFQMFFTGFILAFAILHFILYIYLPNLKSNLFFFFFLIFYAINIYFDHQSSLSDSVGELLVYLRIQRASLPFIQIFAMIFLYSVFNNSIPKRFWGFVFILIAGGLLTLIRPVDNLKYMNIAIGISTLEIIWIISKAIRHKMDGAKIITLGFLILFVFSSYDLLNDMGLVGSIGRLSNAYMFGNTGLMICISIFLAKAFAGANKKIVEQESRRLIIEADNVRKTRELEDARNLQLSLLPQCAEQILGFETCFEMFTASEVGGDYYDYMINDDTLTIVIGDATGHGMKAGNMVVLIKSLFNTMGHTFYIPDFFNHCTRQIKKMNFGNLFMSMSMLKIRKNRVVFSVAGMPAMLIFRNSKKIIEELVVKGMPLGAHDQFPYEQKKVELEKDDIIILMSDGVIELFNESKEMFGVDRVKEIILENYSSRSSLIVKKLYEATLRWRKDIAQNDDMTFVVLKYKP